jgi:hypothetical protein
MDLLAIWLRKSSKMLVQITVRSASTDPALRGLATSNSPLAASQYLLDQQLIDRIKSMIHDAYHASLCGL